MEDTAQQHYIIGDNLRHKGFYEDAMYEFLRSLEILEPLHGKLNYETAKSLYALGVCKRALKEYPFALEYFSQAGAAFDAELQASNKKATNNNDNNDNSDNNDNNDDNAETKQGRKATEPRAVAELQEWTKNVKLNMARTHHSQGVEHQRTGNYDKSIMEHRKALAIREAWLGRDHVETARSHYVMGCALSDRGDFDEALSNFRRALRVRVLKFGKRHIDTNEVRNNIVTVLQARGGITEEKIESYRESLFPSVDLEIQGDKALEEKNADDALVAYRKALETEEESLGTQHPTTCDLYLKLAHALGLAGDLEASLSSYKMAIAIYESMLGKFHVKVASVYHKIAGILDTKGEYDTALGFYCKAYGIFDTVLGPAHEDTIDAFKQVRFIAQKEFNAMKSMSLLN